MSSNGIPKKCIPKVIQEMMKKNEKKIKQLRRLSEQKEREKKCLAKTKETLNLILKMRKIYHCRQCSSAINHFNKNGRWYSVCSNRQCIKQK